MAGRFDVRCSFCGKSQEQVKKLIAGGKDVYICNECVELTYAGALPAPMIQLFHVYPPTCFASNKYRRADRLRAALPVAWP